MLYEVITFDAAGHGLHAGDRLARNLRTADRVEFFRFQGVGRMGEGLLEFQEGVAQCREVMKQRLLTLGGFVTLCQPGMQTAVFLLQSDNFRLERFDGCCLCCQRFQTLLMSYNFV